RRAHRSAIRFAAARPSGDPPRPRFRSYQEARVVARPRPRARKPGRMSAMDAKRLALDTLAIHAGQDPDPTSGAVMTPIVLSSTFAQDKPGKHRGFEYSRSGNPTRQALEECIAALEGGKRGLCFASGSAATATILH